MNGIGTTLKELGWNATEDHIPVPMEHRQRNDIRLMLDGQGEDQKAIIYGDGEEWIKSDRIVAIDN